MARQFREQLEEEASNLESKFDIDPGIDTSLDPKPKPATPATPAAGPSTNTAVALPATTAAIPDPEEEFYPPDHHMHSSNRLADPDPYAGPAGTPSPAPTPAPAEEGGTQSEFDLTSRDPKSS
jgi:hypothetical protein